jgi:hypothetical protein
LKVPKFIMKELVGEMLGNAESEVPADYLPKSKESRCLVQIGEWIFKNPQTQPFEHMKPLARLMAYRCDQDPEAQKHNRQRFKDLYMLLDSYGYGE